MKDYFSSQAALYASFRPVYPEALYDFIFGYVKEKNAAWDAATGNGQVTAYISKHFEKVYAMLQILVVSNSAKPIKQAIFFYSIASAEQTSFASQYFDLIQ